MRSLLYAWMMSGEVITWVMPDVHHNLDKWEQRARIIPDEALRSQALDSITSKAFHCEGGAVYALLAGHDYQRTLEFIVAYQTLCDYLDNLCDRSTSDDQEDFRALHEAMLDALTPGIPTARYYRRHPHQDDGGYVETLVKVCQETLGLLPAYAMIADHTKELASLYCDLQVYKHGAVNDRTQRLTSWFDDHHEQLPEIQWYEFAAACGSTLGIFYLVAQASRGPCSVELIQAIKKAYFPWVQGLHILLDYLIDEEEDANWGDLNFCSYYANRDDLVTRMTHFYRQAQLHVARLPNAEFHGMINRGLLSLYLTNPKVGRQSEISYVAERLLPLGGPTGRLTAASCRVYWRLNASSARDEAFSTESG